MALSIGQNPQRTKRNISADGSIEGVYSLQSTSLTRVCHPNPACMAPFLFFFKWNRSFDFIVVPYWRPTQDRRRYAWSVNVIIIGFLLLPLMSIHPGSTRDYGDGRWGPRRWYVYDRRFVLYGLWVDGTHDLRTIPAYEFRENSVLPKSYPSRSSRPLRCLNHDTMLYR